MNTNWKQIGLVLLFASANIGLTACSSDQIYGDESFTESSFDATENEDTNFDIDAQAAEDLKEQTKSSVQAAESKIEKLPSPVTKAKEKPKATASKKKKGQSL